MRRLKAATLRAALSTFCSFVLLTTAYARADEPVARPFDISPQSLATALSEFARQSQQEILYSPELVAKKLSSGVRGTMQPLAALKLLLKDSALTFTTTAKGAVLVGAPPSGGYTPLSSDEERVAPKATGEDANENHTGEGGEQKNEPDRFRLAQANQAGTSNDSSVGKGNTQDVARRTELTEVVVTAQKRAETVNTTPIAVSALDASQLQNAGVNAVRDLTSAVPDLQIHTIGIDGFIGITIRGISNLSYAPWGNPAISTYVDGVYVDYSTGFADEIYDLDRVEVLRGPQGTLYGRNATGGNLNIVTADPKSTFGAEGDVSYGNYNDVMTHAVLNVPVSDSLAVRAALMQHRSDGYFDTEGTSVRNYGAADDFALRLTGLWTPTDQFKWRLSLDGFVSNGTPGESIQTGANQRPINGLSPYHQPAGADPEPDNYTRSAAMRSRMDWRVWDDLTLTYIAGYQRLLWDYHWATTGQVGAPVDPAFKQYIFNESLLQSHEADITYDTKRLKNVLGATYSDLSYKHNLYGVYPLFNFAEITPYPYQRRGGTEYVKRSWGLFDQATYAVLKTLRLTGGVRYSHDYQSSPEEVNLECVVAPSTPLALAPTLTANSPGCGLVTTPSGTGSWSKISWKAGLDYDLTESALAYASVTTGYKEGGVQPGLPAVFPSTFKPEVVTSYEAGAKLMLLDRSLNIRVAGFFMNYTNLQTFQYLYTGGGSYLVTTNAGKSHIYGVELETEWNATPADHVAAFGTYLHARYTEFNNAVNPLDGRVIPSLAGSRLPNAPEASLRLEYRHDFPLPNGGTLTPLAAFYWQSKSYSQPINIPFYQISAYSKSNLQLTYADPMDRWHAAAYVDNLENHAVRNSDFSSGGVVFSDFGPPRTYGFRLSYRY